MQTLERRLSPNEGRIHNQLPDPPSLLLRRRIQGFCALRLLFAFMGCLLSSVVAETVTARFDSSSEIAVTTAGYSALGKSVDISLGFAPSPGTRLVIVNNTSLGFIEGRFSNLGQGQMLDLMFNGINYKFVANYYGGSGNDLVLLWARRGISLWGSNSTGSFADPNISKSYLPMPLPDLGALAGKTVIAVSAGVPQSIALWAAQIFFCKSV